MVSISSSWLSPVRLLSVYINPLDKTVVLSSEGIVYCRLLEFTLKEGDRLVSYLKYSNPYLL